MNLRCDKCGKFIAYCDVLTGVATRYCHTPDSRYTEEQYITLCKDHNENKLPEGQR